MGDVEFNWLQHKDEKKYVHICQSEHTEFTAHLLSVQSSNKVTNMNPYCSVLPIDSIPPVDPLDPDLTR